MSCCDAVLPLVDPDVRRREIFLASRPVGNDVRQTDLSVPTIHCGGCIQKIERTLGALAGVESVRVNLSTRRVTIRWYGETPPPLIETLAVTGYDAHLYDNSADTGNGTLSGLIRALAVAGFAASNIMMLSVSVWSGADAATRDLFHVLSALIALPALAYSGRIFFMSAWRSLRHGRTNMDVPISIGVLLAFGMSLYETFTHGPHAYFDAAVSLLFFLLIGRTLDYVMRERARTAVKGLARLSTSAAMILQPDGTQAYVPTNEIEPGMSILLAAGERIPVDACIVKGQSEIDRSLVTGESRPQSVAEGAVLEAGTLNLTAPLTIVATAAAKDSFLAEMTRMMEAAESGRSIYRRIADRAARLYAPVVHLTAFLTFLGWMILEGNLHHALTIAVAVLIITCPCALGLAVPMVQVMAARRLFEHGIMVKDGSALERLAEIDTVILDKTGTITRGTPHLIGDETIDPTARAVAVAMAAHSRHPYSRALAALGTSEASPALQNVSEHPGFGLAARIDGTKYRLGRADWAVVSAPGSSTADEAADVVLTKDGLPVARFRFEDQLRPGARETVAELLSSNLSVEILSGDHEENVHAIAATMGVPHVARISPGGKVAHLARLTASGRKALMVGDGLNDAPALAAAHVSMAPASAADVGRNAADLVFLRESLTAVPQAIAVARDARQLIAQNLALAIAYNVIAVPVAILGLVTPLIAAIAMSLSSILVVANALRVKRPERGVHPAHVPLRQALVKAQ